MVISFRGQNSYFSTVLVHHPVTSLHQFYFFYISLCLESSQVKVCFEVPLKLQGLFYWFLFIEQAFMLEGTSCFLAAGRDLILLMKRFPTWGYFAFLGAQASWPSDEEQDWSPRGVAFVAWLPGFQWDPFAYSCLYPRGITSSISRSILESQGWGLPSFLILWNPELLFFLSLPFF